MGFNRLGALPMHKAAEYGHVDMVKLLLKWRASVRDGKSAGSAYPGQTALHCAALRGHVECCQVLLSHRADACACDASGASPLHSAGAEPIHALASHEFGATASVVRLLVAARGDVAAEDNAGRTP